MAALQEALQSLAPVDYSSVPVDHLKSYLLESFRHAQLLLDSVPPPPEIPFNRRAHTASDASEISVSSARSEPPPAEIEALQKEWGKPIRLSAKDNPLGMTVYKATGKDGKGSWFARRSVHEGLGFAKWKKALEREFPETLKVQGSPGEGNIRGIGGERRVEEYAVENVGKLEVYHLSAQFPGPTTPRDFVEMVLTSDTALSDWSNVSEIPRHFMVISKPCKHPECPPRDGFVRGQYESVEFIREVSSEQSLSSESQSREDRNPVEWIMVTRSDPGGGIPRFMVDRGTPSSIVADASKFLDWACSNTFDEPGSPLIQKTDLHSSDADLHDYDTNGHLAGIQDTDSSETTPTHSGVYETFAETVGATVATYAPMIAEYLPGHSPSSLNDTPPRRPSVQSALSSHTADTFVSALEGSDDASDVSTTGTGTSNRPSIHKAVDKQLQKLEHKKRKLDERLAKAREKELTKPGEDSGKEQSALAKAEEKHHRDVARQEEKYRKEMEKLQARNRRKTLKAEEKRRKAEEKEEKAKMQRALESLRSELDVLKVEKEILSRQVGQLQQQNTVLTARIGRLGSVGEEVLREVREELREGAGARSRSSTLFLSRPASERSKDDGVVMN